MWTKYEPWQLTQLSRLAESDTDRLETLLNILWESDKSLLAEVALRAVACEELSVNDCAYLLRISTADVESRLQRSCTRAVADLSEHSRSGQGARIAGGRVSVWEVVREYRKLGDVERLLESFPSIERDELAAALVYARENPQEIEAQISEFETVMARWRED